MKRLEDDIKAFWAWFSANAESIRRKCGAPGHLDIEEQLSEHLDAIDERLAWEIGPGKEGNLLLVISAEGNPEVREFAQAAIFASPRLPGWQFSPYRQPRSFAALEAILHSLGHQIDLDSVRLCPG